jgi:hypothetical protein
VECVIGQQEEILVRKKAGLFGWSSEGDNSVKRLTPVQPIFNPERINREDELCILSYGCRMG